MRAAADHALETLGARTGSVAIDENVADLGTTVMSSVMAALPNEASDNPAMATAQTLRSTFQSTAAVALR